MISTPLSARSTCGTPFGEGCGTQEVPLYSQANLSRRKRHHDVTKPDVNSGLQPMKAKDSCPFRLGRFEVGLSQEPADMKNSTWDHSENGGMAEKCDARLNNGASNMLSKLGIGCGR